MGHNRTFGLVFTEGKGLAKVGCLMQVEREGGREDGREDGREGGRGEVSLGSIAMHSPLLMASSRH
jgi:hypothetical protein